MKKYKVSYEPSEAVYEYVVEADDEFKAEDKAYEMLQEAIGWDGAKDWCFVSAEEIEMIQKVRPRSEVEKLVTDFVEENKISATYGKDSEGLFVVNFVVDEEEE